jgi:glucokinase
VGRALGIVLATLVNSLNLPMHVIGGGVSHAWEAFAPAIFEELHQRSMVYAATASPDPLAASHDASARKTIVTRALLGSDAGLYGAARLPMMAGRRR